VWKGKSRIAARQCGGGASACVRVRVRVRVRLLQSRSGGKARWHRPPDIAAKQAIRADETEDMVPTAQEP
jgi:hypothetical protein